MTFRILLVMAVSALFINGAELRAESVYEKDVIFALEEIEKQCGHFFRVKEIDWAAVSKQFKKEAKEVKTDQEHLVLLWRLLARLEDGHAQVRPLEKGKDVKWPDQPKKSGMGMFWCQVKDKIYVKNTWGKTKAAGVVPGMEVVSVGKEKVRDWLKKRVQDISDDHSFSTPQQAFFYATHWGLREEVGTEVSFKMKSSKGGRKSIDLTITRANQVPSGPAFFPKPKGEYGRAGKGDLNWCVMKEGGWGYIHVRRCKGNLPEMMDQALTELGNVPGVILDWRGNSGGGFDHDALFGRFIPKGKTTSWGKRYSSSGETPYGGPVVVIIDATVRSAGETGAGIFKEDGRAYMIGESQTAGMSASKKRIGLPSELFELRVSVRSNKSRFNSGKGIEGVGVIPHEFVAFDPKDLVKEKDTLIERAVKLLKRYPQKEVPYDPKKFGWKK